MFQVSRWALSNEVRYVYDGNLVIQERDGNNLPAISYTRGRDLSGSLEGAGGIGGLLARTDHSTLVPGHSFYHSDGNGNVTALISTNQLLVAKYLYDPFGNVLSMSGPLAEANLYRFSSKEVHPSSGLVYYLYRYYDPNLQRWLNRDPLGELGFEQLMRSSRREIWTEFLQRPKLKRVVDAHADVCSQPVTWDEKVFVRLVIVHLHSVHQASSRGLFIKPEGLRRDVWSFFSLPIPATVWEDEKAFQDDEFVDYVEQCRMWK